MAIQYHHLYIISCPNHTLGYSLHQQKVYTCGKAKDGDTRTKSLRQQFLLESSHFFESQNEAWSSLDQLNGRFGALPTFYLAPLSFEYSARQKCILSFGGDCIAGRVAGDMHLFLRV